MRRCCWKVRGVLALTVVPVVALSTAGASAVGASEPVLPLGSVRPLRGTSLTQQPIASLPLKSPPVNGFQPFVVFGLTDENENDFYAPASATPGGSPVPNPARYFIGTLDSGSSTHIISDSDAQLVNLFAHGLEGTNTVPLTGASGQEVAFVSDALGFYVAGLGNATAGANGPIVSPASFQGMTNAPILTADTGSILPNIIGSPMFAYNQITMLNSQTQRLTVNGQTYQGPQVELRAPNTPVPGNFTRRTLEMFGPPPAIGATSGPIGPVIFTPDFFGSSDFSNNPLGPSTWNSLYTNVNLTNDTRSANEQQLLFDTGAQVSVLSTAVANSLGISTNPGEETPPDFFVEVLGVGGIRDVPGYFIDTLSMQFDLADPIVWTNVPVLVLNLPDPRDLSGFVPGILGMNLFTDRDLIVNADLADPFFAISEEAITPKWTGNAGGNWGDVTKWMLGVPDVPEKPANFTSTTAAPQTINVDGDFIAGRITFDNAGSYTISGTGRLTLEMIAGASLIDVASGSHTISAPMTFASDTAINVTPAGSTLTISNDVVAANADVTKSGAGTLAMKNIRAASLAVNAGKVQILANGSSSGVSDVGGLAIAPGARLDLRDNDLVVRDGNLGTWSGSAYTGITGLVDAGRGNAGNAQWDGATGIVTSDSRAMNNNNLASLGVATGAQVAGLTGTATATWNGQIVDADDVLVMFTYAGDANLDGAINIDDYGRIDANVAQSGSVFGWYNGDFNYDGSINIDDYGIIDANVSAQGAPLNAAALAESLGATAVPEPSLLGLSALALLARRRRR